MSDLLGLPCAHGEDATVCEKCWPVSEVLYAVRRADGSDIGEYSFVVVGGPNDWAPAEDDADGIDDQTEYEIVKMTVEVIGTRILPECNDPSCTEPATHWGLCEPHARLDDPTGWD